MLSDKLIEQYEALKEELGDYETNLHLNCEIDTRTPMLQKKHIVAINKADLYPEELQQAVVTQAGEALSYPLFISAKANLHIDTLKNELRTLLQD